ncbi:MAG: glycosyltransferase family 4 protein [Rhizobiaceae bacterium]|nr:glycosyltransferase family 4 protein [Rhizobiaceae bacterium]
MRVAHLKSRYGAIGGIESMLGSVMPELAGDPSVDPLMVVVCAEPDPDLERRLTADGAVALRRLAWSGVAAAPLAALRLARLLRRERIDLIHTHDMRANLLAALVRPFSGTPWLCHIHGWLGPTHSGIHRLYEAVDRNLVRFADHVLVGSNATLREVRDAGARSTSVAWNAVSSRPGRASRAELGLPPDKVVATVLGRLHRGKGQDLFIDALAGLAHDARWHAVIVGVGETSDELRRRAADAGIAGRVTFTGLVSTPADWVGASDIVVVPSRKESLPLTCLEGMAQGKALVVSSAGDMPVVISDGVSGRVVPVDDVVALRAAIASLLADGDLRRRMGEAARQRYETHHTTAALAAAMTDCARRTIELRRGRDRRPPKGAR